MSTPVLTFEPTNHVYKYENRIVPSVTQILEAMGCYKGTEYMEEKHRLGHYIHSTCEFYDLGELDEGKLDDFLKGYLESYKKFKEFIGAEVLLNEVALYSQIHQYAGTVDRLLQTAKAGKILLDFKSGTAQPAHRLQCGAYSWLALEAGWGKDGGFTSGCLYLKEDGTMPTWKSVPDNRTAMNDWFSILGTWKWKKENNLL